VTARPNAFCGRFDVVSRARRSRALAEAIERQQTRLEVKVRPPALYMREARQYEAKPSAGRDE
jgi:hypothetical protein